MSKAVMISIHSKWCDLIASGRKIIEIRKTAPKIDTPFKCYIYHTVTRNAGVGFNHWCDCWQLPNGDFVNAGGKVVGEFIVDRIDEQIVFHKEITRIMMPDYKEKLIALCEAAMLSNDELHAYIDKDGEDIAIIYGLHISNLVIYNKPKELGEFISHCSKWKTYPNDLETCRICCKHNKAKTDTSGWLIYRCDRRLTHPPQSWCYVEEVIT
ncbi:MAG: hypothetical protein K2L37_04605 [Lactobacillus sp.]|nr:hypothetical protein [Lactobacillus sp.]